MKINSKIFVVINILLVAAMVLHVGISMYLHAMNPFNSAPAWVCLVDAVYYLIPLAVVNLGYLIIRRKNK